MLSHVMFTYWLFSEGCRGIKDIITATEHTHRDLTWTEIFYQAVIFFTHFISTERGQRSETGGILGDLNLPQPWPNMCLYETASPQAAGDWGRNRAVGQPSREGKGRAEVLQMGTRECRKSTERTMWGGWGLAPVFTHHAIPLPGHSTVQSTVIWTKNIGLSFLLPFF